MASARALVTIKRGGKRIPPGEIIHELTDADLDDLRGFVRVIADETPESDEDGDDTPEGGNPPVPMSEPGDEAPDEADGDEGGETEGGETGDGEPKDRVGDVKAAIDLLEADDFTATGRPKAAALAAVLGFKPTGAEIGSALALREAEGL